MNQENVSPLQFGDFNDDILQLMKPEDNHLVGETPNGPVLITHSSASYYANAYECAANHAITNCNQLKQNILTPMMSSQPDPGNPVSAHGNTVPAESYQVNSI